MPSKNIDLIATRPVNTGNEYQYQWWRNFKVTLYEGDLFHRDMRNAEDQCEVYYMEPGKEKLVRLHSDPNKPLTDSDRELALLLYAKAYNGELFVRAVGEEYPRRIGVGKDFRCEVSNYTVQGVNPVEKPEFPGIWAWLVYNLTNGQYYAKEMEGYQRQLRQHENAESFSSSFKAISNHYNNDCKEGEAEYLEDLKKRREDEAREAEMKKEQAQQKKRDQEQEQMKDDPERIQLLEKMGDTKNEYLDVCMELDCYDNLKNNMKHLMNPEYQARYNPNEARDRNGETKGSQLFGHYPWRAQTCMKYTGLAPEQLGVLAMFACCTPEASDERRAYLYGHYKNMADTLGKEGKYMDIAKVSLAAIDRSQHRIDLRHLMEDVMLRKDYDMSRETQVYVNKGRKILGFCMQEAFYDVPVPQHLGRLVTDAVQECKILFNSSPELDHEAVAYGMMAGELAKVCRNMKIFPLAKEEKLKMEMVEELEGMSRMATLRLNGLKAQKKLLEAAAKGERLENTAALLADVQLMGIACAEHRRTYEAHTKTVDYRSGKKDLEDFAENNYLFGALQHNRDCRTLCKYGQDATFPSSSMIGWLADSPKLHSQLRQCFMKAPEIRQVAGRSPQEIADYVRGAAEDKGTFHEINMKIMKRWRGERTQDTKPHQEEKSHSKEHNTKETSHEDQKQEMIVPI